MAKAKKPQAATHAQAEPAKRGRGRPRGAKNKRTEELEAAMAKLAAEKAEGEVMPLDLMLEVMRNPDLPWLLRLSMAEKAAPYCHPRLSTVQANVDVKTGHEAALKELM